MDLKTYYNKKYNVAIVGINNLIGKEILRLLRERDFPVNALRLLVTESVGERKITFNNADYVVDVISKNSFKGMDIVFFANEKDKVIEYGWDIAKRGIIVIDNSGAFSSEEDVPLVVPEVNEDKLKTHKGIIASPHYFSVFLSIVLKPIYSRVSLRRIVANCFQSVCEKGEVAMQELRLQTREFLKEERVREEVIRNFLAFNIIPYSGEIREGGYTETELNIADELRKIIHDENILINITTLQLPLLYGAAASVNIESKKEITKENARFILTYAAPGVELIDEMEKLKYPVPLEVRNRNEVLVGRIRGNKENSLELWIVGDNLKKGNSLNMVQIAESLIKQKII